MLLKINNNEEKAVWRILHTAFFIGSLINAHAQILIKIGSLSARVGENLN